MGLLELILIAIGLSMDAFAVSICKGLSMKQINKTYCILIGIFFGGFQALMPLVGWLVGSTFDQYITAFDHWIAFGLLAFLGIKMIVEALKPDEEEDGEVRIDIKELFGLAIATSIDALAVGITFAFLQVKILSAISLIGCITFGFSIGGVFIGNVFGNRFKQKAEIAGGLILVAIGVKVLVQHLFGL